MYKLFPQITILPKNVDYNYLLLFTQLLYKCQKLYGRNYAMSYYRSVAVLYQLSPIIIFSNNTLIVKHNFQTINKSHPYYIYCNQLHYDLPKK